MKRKNILIVTFLTIIFLFSCIWTVSAEGTSTQDTYTGTYSVGSSSPEASGTIVLKGIYTDSTLRAEDAIAFSPMLTTSSTSNKTYCLSIRVDDLAEGCTIKSIKADFDGTGLPNSNAHNISLSQSDNGSWSCILYGNTSGGYVSAFTITLTHACAYLDELTTPSTCTEQGTISDVCSCGHAVVKETLELADHQYGEWVIDKEATPYEEGTKSRTCTICNRKETVAIPATSGASIADSGSAGTINWYYYSDGHLRITGNGNVYSAATNGKLPWGQYKDAIKSLSIEGEITQLCSFEDYTAIETVEITDTVTEIGNEFEGCTNLRSIKLPSNLETLNTYAFYDCESLESLSLPDSLTLISDSVFLNCKSLKELVIPDSVNYLGKGVFVNCSGLTKVILSNNIEWIPESAFWGCSNLSSIVIPEDVSDIRDNAFRDCSNLSSIEFLGAAPSKLGSDVFTGTSNSLVLYYDPDTPGWDDEKWDSYNLQAKSGGGSPEEDELRYQYVTVKLNSYYFLKNKTYDNPPAVTVTNYKGKKLTEGVEYEVKYEAAPYTEGEHTVNVTGIAPFTFEKSVSYEVLSGNVLEWNSTATYGNVYFKKDSSNQNLIIFGSGPMRDVVNNTSYEIPGYCYTANDAVYLRGIKTIIVDEGVTTIGSKAFSTRYNVASTNNWFPDIETIYIPSSVTEIKDSALTPEGGFESVYIYSKNVVIADGSINAKHIYGYKGSTAYDYALVTPNVSFHEICENHKIKVINKVDAKCETEGYSGDYICSVCGESIRQGSAIDPLDHDYQSEENTAIAATCTTDGKEADQKCSRCGKIIEGSVIPASHNLLKHEVHDATCSEVGNIEYYECTSCKKLFVKSGTDDSLEEVTSDSITIPLSKHTWGSWSIISNPTCTKKGIRVRFCDKCDAEERVEIDVIDHESSSTYTVDKEATCKEEGSESIHCKNCGTVIEGTSRAIPKATKHSFGEWTTTKAATEKEDGQQSRTCSVCGISEYKTIPKLPQSGSSASTSTNVTEEKVIVDLPKVKMSKPKAAKKAVTVKWKKVSKKNRKKIQGIEIQYSLDGFKTISGTKFAKKTKKSIKVKGLQSKKKYWVRIRAYKNAADGKHVSAWKVKTVKIK